MYSDFKNKEIYIKGKELYSLINNVFDDKIPYSLKDQISRAAVSIILNFSEGYGRFSKNDKKHFYIMARASLNETIACFDLMEIHTNIPEEVKNRFLSLSEELSKMLSGLINTQK